jgi:two-component system LytT family response regulator
MQEQIITAFIADDEFQSREVIKLLLGELFPEIKIVGEADNVQDALSGIEDKKPQLVFLDIQIRNETAFALLDKMGTVEFEIIFTTAHNEYAVKAFRYSALDYLLKPIDAGELKTAVEKAKERISWKQNSIAEQIRLLNHHLDHSKVTAGKIAIPSPEGMAFVSIQDIIYCHGHGNYTELLMLDGTKVISSRTLKLYEDILTEHTFFRAHKSYLINLAHIKSYLRGEGGTAVMINGHEIEIARRNKADFLNLFKG